MLILAGKGVCLSQNSIYILYPFSSPKDPGWFVTIARRIIAFDQSAEPASIGSGFGNTSGEALEMPWGCWEKPNASSADLELGYDD